MSSPKITTRRILKIRFQQWELEALKSSDPVRIQNVIDKAVKKYLETIYPENSITYSINDSHT